MIPETGVVVYLLVVEDQAGLVVKNADEAVGQLPGFRPQHDRREGLSDALGLHDDVKMRVRESKAALRDGLADVENLQTGQIILVHCSKTVCTLSVLHLLP